MRTRDLNDGGDFGLEFFRNNPPGHVSQSC